MCGKLVNYCDYERLGFNAVCKEDFGKLRRHAERIVEKYTFGRIDPKKVSAGAKYAVCQIIDIIYEDARNGRLTGFSNEGYQENYRAQPSGEATSKALQLLYTFFERDLTYRGVNKYKPGTGGCEPIFFE